MTTKYRPLVFVGPSGIGKGTIEKKMMEKHPERFAFSVSHTTRAPRPGEEDGVAYHFTTRDKMEQDIKDGKFLETCEVHGNLYGTSLAAIRSVIDSGKICVIDVNIDGAVSISKTDLNPYIIFLRPVSVEALEARLKGRGTEDDATVNIRMQTAKRELERHDELISLWNLDIINDTLEETMSILQKALTDLYGFNPIA